MSAFTAADFDRLDQEVMELKRQKAEIEDRERKHVATIESLNAQL